jgi:hypothetical protein
MTAMVAPRPLAPNALAMLFSYSFSCVCTLTVNNKMLLLCLALNLGARIYKTQHTHTIGGATVPAWVDHKRENIRCVTLQCRTVALQCSNYSFFKI